MPIPRTLSLTAVGLSLLASQAVAQTAAPSQNALNRFQAESVLSYSQNFESGAQDVITLAPAVSITTLATEVIAGTRSLKLDGRAYAQLRPESLALQPGRAYVLELRYRVVRAGSIGVVLRVPGAGAAEFTMIGALPSTPMSGTASWTVPVPNAAGATILFYTEGAAVALDDLSMAAKQASVRRASVPLVKSGFPRLGDYMLLGPSGIAWLHGTDPAAAEAMASRFDLHVGSGFDHTQGAGDWVPRLRQQNPNAIVLPYRQAYMAQYEGSTGLQDAFNRRLAPSWFMRTPDGALLPEPAFPQNVQLDHTRYAPAVGGLTLADYTAGFLATAAMPSGLWDGLFFDQSEWYVNPLLGTPPPPIDIDRNGQADGAAALHAAWAEGFNGFFRRMQRQFGYAALMMGNAGYLAGNRNALSALNGWIAERAEPYASTPAGDWITTNASGWYRLLDNYLATGRYARAPQLPLLVFSGAGLGEATGTTTLNGSPLRRLALEPRDLRRMRLGLTTTLLGNGFFDYDLVDNTTPTFWFDEYAVTSTGTATTSAAGKGYLGQPLGAAVEIASPGATIFSIDFETPSLPAGVYTSGRVTTAASEVVSGNASLVVTKAAAGEFAWFVWAGSALTAGKPYQIHADYRILSYSPETFSGMLGLGFLDAGGNLPPGRSGSIFMPDTVGAGQRGTLRASSVAVSGDTVLGALLDVGAVAVDNIRLVEGPGGAWRRDFENGVVLVNPTPESITLTQAQVAGPLARTGLRRIKGTQAPAWNDGTAVIAGITIPPGDGIILLASRMAAATPAAPAPPAVAAAGTTATVQWPPVAGYPAGYVLEYGEDALTRVAAAGTDGTVTLEDLLPGATYRVRVAAVDFLGRIGPYSPATPFVVPGTTNGRPSFSLGGTGSLTPGTQAVVVGTALADVTRVEVNGVGAEILSRSATSVTFVTPREIAGADAILNVFRGTAPGIETLVQVAR